MSISLMSEIWRRDCSGDLVLLLALADHADDDGGNVYPSLEYTAWKIGVDRSTVKRKVKNLRARGVLRAVREATRYEPAHYEIDVEMLPKKPPFEPRYQRGYFDPAGSSAGGVAARGQGGRNRGVRGGIAVPPKPPEEPSGRTAKGAQLEQPTLDVEFEARVDRFLAWFRSTVEEARGEPIRAYRPADREAAREILRRHPDGAEVREVLACALADHRWFATKVKSVPTFRQHYADVRVKWIGQRQGRAMAAEIAARNGRVDTSATDPDYPIETHFGEE